MGRARHTPDSVFSARTKQKADMLSQIDMTAGRLSDSQITWISGTTAGLVATFAKQPIQRVKWIKQTSDATRSYGSIARDTLRSHGWRGFFSGSLAAVCRNVPHSVLVYSIYPHCVMQPETFWTRFVAGYCTMIASTIVTHPLDTLRVRLSVAQSPTNMWGAGVELYKTGGFYSGFGATLLGAGPRGAIGFAIFETAKTKTKNKFLCGYVAGLVAESVVYPLDTVRRRQQAVPAWSRVGVITGMLRIAQTEGVRGLFKGISLNLVKNPAATAVSFAVNDAVKDFLGYGGVTTS